MKKFYIFTAVLFGVFIVGDTTLKRVCYYVAGKLQASQIDANLCTHIIFGFVDVVNDALVPAQSSDVQIYQDLLKLKDQNPDLKIMISIQCMGADGELQNTARNATRRQLFIKQALQFLKDNKFDGIDIDWEFPGMDGARLSDVQRFTDLLIEFRAAIDALSPEETKPLFTAAVAAAWIMMRISYKTPEMAKSVDFINVMGYDYYFYAPYYPFTQYNAALYKRSEDLLITDRMNIVSPTVCESSLHSFVFVHKLSDGADGERTITQVRLWQKLGVPKEKIVVGIPTYGRTYTLTFPFWNNLRAPASGVGSGDGIINVTSSCTMLASGSKRVFDTETMVPYLYNATNWASYEDVESFTHKANYIVNGGYAGVMTWNLNHDDWSNTCGFGKFPLHKVLRSIVTS